MPHLQGIAFILRLTIRTITEFLSPYNVEFWGGNCFRIQLETTGFGFWRGRGKTKTFGDTGGV